MKRFTLSLMMILLSSFFIFGQTILAVDRDGSAWSADFADTWTYYMDALDAGGYTYTLHEVMDGADDGPDLATMEMYDIVIWFTGETWSGGQTMTSNDMMNLGSYLDGGGTLFLSAQDWLWDNFSSAGVFSAGEFPYDYLGLREVSQDNWTISSPEMGVVDGIAGSLADGMQFDVQDIFTAKKDGLYVDLIVEHAGMDLFNLTTPTPEGICGVQYENRAFKTVFTTAEFGAIVDAQDQADLMAAVVDYLAGGGAATGPCYNFDDLTAGGLVAEQLGGYWTTWGGTSADDATVVDTLSNSPDNSFVVDAGAVDLIFQLADAPLSTGMWSYSHYMYVPTGFSGYFNVQTDPTPGVAWNLDLYFDDGGTGAFAGQSTETFTYTQDTWFMVEIVYDLDAGLGLVFFDGDLMLEFENTLTIGGIDYYGSTSGGPAGAYYDDVCFKEVSVGGCENFDELLAGGYVADQLGGFWTTWSGGSGDDAMVVDTLSNSPDNSFVVDAGAVDLIYQFGYQPLSTGTWSYSHYMYVPTGFSGYFNVQTDPTPGVAWNLDLYFDDGGTGAFAGQSTETFTYTQDTWFMVEIIYDLDAGLGLVFFDGDLMLEFENTLTIGGIDYYGSTSGGPAGAYYDDVCFKEVSLGGCENFDGLLAGGYVADQLGGFWTTWSGGSGDDAMVVDTLSNSPDNSFVVDAGAVDLIYQFGYQPISTGTWKYSHYMYVPTGFSGYFNVQTDPTPGVAWNLDLYFDDGGTGAFAGQSTEEFTYTQDTWFMVEIIYDLDAGYGLVFFDGELMLDFENTLTIGGIDYYGANTGGPPGAYYDDVCFEEVSVGGCENFDELLAGGYVADQLGGFWTTWSGGSGDDAMVVDTLSNSPDNSFVVDAGAVDLIYQFGYKPISAGTWKYSHYMYVPTGFSGYFNVQTDPTPGVAWNLDLYFDDGGTGAFAGQSTETFTYTQDTWFMVEIIYGLDAGYGLVYFDGTLILEFENTLTIGGIDYYGANTGGPPGAYYDDVCFGKHEGVGVEDPSVNLSSSEINIYPNPTKDYVNIQAGEEIIDVRIFNQIGQMVEYVSANSKHIIINTTKLNKGVYVVQVRTETGTEVRKLMVQ